MSVFFDVLIIVVLLSVYGYIHSVLASRKAKEFFRSNFGKAIAFYRLGYNLFAIVGLYIIWDLAPHPSIKIYQLPHPYDIIVIIPQLIGLAGLIWCFKYICFREFAGLNQIDRFFKNEYSENDLDEKYTFIKKGPYLLSRHPIYFFSIIILLFRAEMNLFYLTMFISFVAYFYIGSIYEEKKLVGMFGNDYLEYQKEVPRIFPIKIFFEFKQK